MCDYLSGSILVVDCGSEKVDSIQRIVKGFGFKPDRVRLEDISRASHAGYAGVIVSGSPILLTETAPSKYLRLLRFTASGKCPTLGICFGHQIIRLLHGAKIFRGIECRVNQTVKVLDENGLFEGLAPRLSLREDHCEGITLPPQFLLLATSASYAVEAMKHPDKELYGVQFHPEASGAVGVRILENFLRLCK